MSKKKVVEEIINQVVADQIVSNEQTIPTVEANVEVPAVETNVELPAVNTNDFTSRLVNALAIDENSYIHTVTKKDGTTTEVIKKQYKLVNPVGKRAQLNVYDIDIITSMEKINSALKGRTLLSYVICKELSNINESGKLKDMGFKTIADFGKAVYGLESSTINHYTKIGFNFINSDYTIKDGLPELTVSHFIELNSLVTEDKGIDDIIDLYQTGVLIDGMSTKIIREKVKAIKNGALLEDKDKENGTPVDDKENDTPVDNKENDTPVDDKENNTPVEDSKKDTPVEDGKSDTPLEPKYDFNVELGKALVYLDSVIDIITKATHVDSMPDETFLSVTDKIEYVISELQTLVQ